MKKLIPLFFLALLFCSCSHDIKNWICISATTDDDTKIMYDSYEQTNYIATKTDKTLVFNIFLTPECNDDILIINVYSSDPEKILIESVDAVEKTITAHTLSKGNCNISIVTKSHGSTQTLPIRIN